MTPRNRRSAKAAGARFERLVADYLAEEIDDRIDRAPKTGAKDKGDINGLRVRDQKVVIECKDTARPDLAGWAREAAVEAANAGALTGVIIHKRHGVAKPQDQWVTMTLEAFTKIIKESQ